METIADEVGWVPTAKDRPEVKAILRDHAPRRSIEVTDRDGSIRVQRHLDGSITADRSLIQTHADLSAQLAANGFRFPTSDEWEYACGAGASTLFRWGDHPPCDRYPTDISPAEADWRREWVFSGGTLERPPGGFTSDWDEHRQHNAFGLQIAANPYKCELVAEADITRAGDGGVTICGGAGFLFGWLPLATAYAEPAVCQRDPMESILPDYTIGRRV